jgi:proteasome alpha subunit
MYSPYDFNESIAHRAEYVEERLKGGAPVVALSYDQGILVFTLKRTQRKVYEIYDKLIYSAIGNQADVEAVRLAAIDFAHQEGFARSPDDVSIQRLVGFAISPPLKRSFGDTFNTPTVMRAVFAEIGRLPQDDAFFVLNYDGDFTTRTRFAAVAGSEAAEEAMRQALGRPGEVPNLPAALQRAAEAWRAGSRSPQHDDDDDDHDEEADTGGEPEAAAAGADADPLQAALQDMQIEAAVLERNSPRESKFRLLTEQELVF